MYVQQAVCVRRKQNEKKTRNPGAPKTHHEIHSSPVTATISRRRATKHVPHASAHSPASINAGFVEIGLVQLSQSVKTTNVTHTQTNKIMAPCTHPGTKRLFCPTGKKRSRSLRSLGLASLLVERYMRQGSLIRTCSRPCRFEGKKTTPLPHESPPHPKHIRLKMHFLCSGNSLYGPASCHAHQRRYVRHMPSVQPTEQPRPPPPRSRGSDYMPQHPSGGCCLNIPLVDVCRRTLSRQQ